MKLKIEIKMDNEAFQPDPRAEVFRILQAIADMVDDHGIYAHDARKIQDVNGNTVGTVRVGRS